MITVADWIVASSAATSAVATLAIASLTLVIIGQGRKQRELFERQVHSPAIEEIRSASRRLYQTAGSTQERAEILEQLRDWLLVLSGRALSFPSTVYALLSEAYEIGQRVNRSHLGHERPVGERDEYSDKEIQMIAVTLGTETQNIVDAYWRREIPPRFNLPKPDENLHEYLRARSLSGIHTSATSADPSRALSARAADEQSSTDPQ